MKMENKRKFLTALAVLTMTLFLTSGLSAAINLTKEEFSSGCLKTTSGAQTEIFYSLNNDGQLENYEFCPVNQHESSYNSARTASEADSDGIFKENNHICFGQDHVALVPGHANDVVVKRGYLYFNTADKLNENLHIISAKLTLYGRYKEFEKGGQHFDIFVQNGGNFPHDDLELGDYDYTLYSGNGVNNFNSRNFKFSDSSPKQNVLTLNSDGISWIKKSGNKLTKFCLRSSRDVSGDWGWENSEYLSFWSSEKGRQYRPKLELTYTRKPTASISGPDPSNPTKNEKVEFEASGADPDGDQIIDYTWRVDGEVQESTSTEFTCTFNNGGTHSVSLKVKDSNGAWSDWATKEFTVSNNVGPTDASISGSSSPSKFEEETYTFSARDRNKEKLTFTINWGAGEDITETVSSNSKGECSISIGHTYTVQTSYQISLTVEDSQGETDSCTLPITVCKSKSLVLEDSLFQRILTFFPKLSQFTEKIGIVY